MHSNAPGPQLPDLDCLTRPYAPVPSEFYSRIPESNKALQPTSGGHGSWKRRSQDPSLELGCRLPQIMASTCG